MTIRSRPHVLVALVWAAAMTATVATRESETGEALFEKVWTPAEGLGPLVNAQSCVACHERPGSRSASTDNMVLVSPEVTDASGGRVFPLFQIGPNGSTLERPLPRLAARRRPPPLLGLGLLEAAIVPNTGAAGSRGRFGWKGRFETIDAAVAAAFANEMGLLSPQFAGGHPEISSEQVRLVSEFVRLLPPPERHVDSAAAGRRVFDAAGCASCHRPTLRTGQSPIPGLRDRVFEPWTDLALHDMGAALSDGWDDGDVRGSVFRTTPLWGLSRSGPPYLHDGRAATLERAIELHGGEAERAATGYRALSDSDREQLLRFLRSL